MPTVMDRLSCFGGGTKTLAKRPLSHAGLEWEGIMVFGSTFLLLASLGLCLPISLYVDVLQVLEAVLILAQALLFCLSFLLHVVETCSSSSSLSLISIIS